MKQKLFTADYQQIKSGELTDVYFQRTMQVLEARGINKRVRAEFIIKSFPHSWEWGVFTGLHDCCRLMEGSDVTIRAVPEGTIFRSLFPVMEIEGKYNGFCVQETALLGFICQSSGVATKAARCRLAAEEKGLVHFGARRIYPTIVPMIDKNAYIGGCDGVSVTLSARMMGQEPVGTIPHSLILVVGDTVEALKAFDEAIPKDVARVALIDTFNDEKFEALNVAEALGKNLFAVRFDTPRSRRGNFLQLLEEVRWELDIRGHSDVKIFVSGGVDEDDIIALKSVVDSFGVGTAISNAPVLDFAMDIVEVEGAPTAKRGKMSGAKDVSRCSQCGKDVMTPMGKALTDCTCGGKMEPLLEVVLQRGKIIREEPEPKEIRDYVLQQLKQVAILQ